MFNFFQHLLSKVWFKPTFIIFLSLFSLCLLVSSISLILDWTENIFNKISRHIETNSPIKFKYLWDL